MSDLTIDINDIMSVYSGKLGCACGCRGKHTYASKYRNAAQMKLGRAISDDEVSDTSVKRILKTMETTPGKVKVTKDYISLDTETRTYLAYFR